MRRKKKPAPKPKARREKKPSPSATAEAVPEWIPSLTRVAAWIQSSFKIPCSRQTLNNWKKRVPPFPCPKDSNRYFWPDIEEWVKKEILNGGPGGGSDSLALQAVEAEARSKIRKDKREAFEFDVAQKKYISKGSARQTVVAAVRMYHGMVRRTLEKDLTDQRRLIMRELKVPEDIITAFFERDVLIARGLVDAIEQECAKAGATPVEEVQS